MVKMQAAHRFTFVSLFVLLLSTVFPVQAENWPRFRGASGNPSVADDPRLPDRWSGAENVAWRTEIPGLGWSSPVVWRNRVFLTTVVNEKAEENEKPKRGLYLGPGRRGIPSGTHHWWVYCLDLETGTILWKREALSGSPRVGRHPKNTYAAETPAVDSDRVYALFGDHGLFCYTHDGDPVWTHPIEAKKTMADYGAAASPVVHAGQVIYAYDNQEESYIASLDARTGEQRWRAARDERSTWATPLIWTHPARTEIVVPGKNQIRSYDLSGNVVWHMDARMSNLVIPSPFEANGMVYIASGYFADQSRPGFAVKPGAAGDITLGDGENSNEFVRWYQPKAGPYNTTPLVHKGIYYLLLDRGMMSAYDALTGEILYDRVRFPRGADRVPPTFTAAPWAYGDRVFCLTETGKTIVVQAGNEFKVLGENDLDEMAMACPAIADGKLLIRTLSKLYCIARPED